ncbi:MAG: hypothetical protein LBP70_00040 [Mycoplasmataceae bacterium]|jgi:hypothetical protein|nr:hypothetical protein [Mycoplasmataceae bacterium]
MYYKTFHTEGINALIKNEIIYNNEWSKTDRWENYYKFIRLLREWIDEYNNKRIWLDEENENIGISLKELKYYKTSKVLIPSFIIVNVGDRPDLKLENWSQKI